MTARPLSRRRQILLDACIVSSLLAAAVITYYSIGEGIYDVFPYFYLIPIILIAFTHPRMSIYGTVMVGWIYLALVYLIRLPDVRSYTLATVWFYIFVSLGVLISTYSQVYRTEGEKSCGAYYNSQAGVFSYDREDLRIRDANRKFAHMIRYECDELMKKSLPDLIPDAQERENFLSKVRDLRRVGDIEVRFRAWDGSMRWALVSAAETAEPGVICTAVDITDNKLSQEALTQANKKLNLLNNVTRHDILNQLTALLGFLEISRQDTKDPGLLKYLEKVFYNLIDNSLRHGEHVTEIVIRTVERAESLDIIIEDNGAGIPESQKERIFRREYFKNTGFGLFLSREILAITNLTIRETGTAGKGARFVIRVPREHFRLLAAEPAGEIPPEQE